jgi:ATP-binding cassette subfamily B multidrug efflux pump
MRGMQVDTDYKALDISLLKRLLVFLKPYKKYVFLAILLTLFTTSLAPLRPYLTKVAIDDYISKSDWNGLLFMVILIFAVVIAYALLQYLLNYLLQWIGQKVLYDIRIKMFEHIQGLSLRFYDKNPVGRLVTRVTNDVEALNNLFSSGIVNIIADVLLLFWIIGFMLFINWELTLYALAILPFVGIGTFLFKTKVRNVFRKIRANLARMNSFLNELITGIMTIKLFSQEKYLNTKFDEINSERKDLLVKAILYYALFFPFIEMANTIGIGVVLWYSAENILSGIMTVGILIAFLQYAEMMFRPIRDLSEKYTTLQSAMASAERIFGFLDTRDFIEDTDDAIEHKEIKKNIEFKDLSFSYDGVKWVLKNVNFTVEKGSTVAIVGSTGSGKTTLISLLCRFYDYEKGDILIDGVSIRSIKQKSLLSQIALVMQDVFLFSRSIEENISLGNDRINKDKVLNAAKELGAYDFIKDLRDNFDTVLNERGSSLSSGQRQLLSFCRAYAADPNLLILDEATSSIDSESEEIIQNSLEKLLKKRTSIIIAHRLSTIKKADKIVVLHKGSVREIGTHSELLANDDIYTKLYLLQLK